MWVKAPHTFIYFFIFVSIAYISDFEKQSENSPKKTLTVSDKVFPLTQVVEKSKPMQNPKLIFHPFFHQSEHTLPAKQSKLAVLLKNDLKVHFYDLLGSRSHRPLAVNTPCCPCDRQAAAPLRTMSGTRTEAQS